MSLILLLFLECYLKFIYFELSASGGVSGYYLMMHLLKITLNSLFNVQDVTYEEMLFLCVECGEKQRSGCVCVPAINMPTG